MDFPEDAIDATAISDDEKETDKSKDNSENDNSKDESTGKDSKTQSSSSSTDKSKDNSENGDDDKTGESDTKTAEEALQKARDHAKNVRDKLSQSNREVSTLQEENARLKAQLEGEQTATYNPEAKTVEELTQNVEVLRQAILQGSATSQAQNLFTSYIEQGIEKEDAETMVALMENGHPDAIVAAQDIYFQAKARDTAKASLKAKQDEDLGKVADKGSTGNGTNGSNKKTLTTKQVVEHIAKLETHDERMAAFERAWDKAPSDAARVELQQAYAQIA